MKTKGIPFWEQHLEHFVLGAAVVVMIGFAVMQFIGDPNSVDVSGVGKVGPGQIDALLEDKARAIGDLIDGAAMEIPDPTPVLSTFQGMKAEPVVPATTLAFMSPRVTPALGTAVTSGNRPFVVPDIPAPFNLLAVQYFDTLSEETVTEHPDLKKVLPAAPPYDITWVTTAATFDAAVVRKQFGQPGPNGEAPLPLSWYNDRVDFIDVRIEREELVAGKWVKSMLLEPIPGQLTFRPKLTNRVDSATRDEILWIASDPIGRTNIIQPEFYTGAALAWQPPNKANEKAKANPDEDPAITDIRERLARLTRERDRIETKIRELNCPAESQQPPPNDPARPTGGGPAAAPGAGAGVNAQSGGSGRSGAGQTTAATEAECKKLRRNLKSLNTQVQRAQAELDRLLPDELTEPKPVVVAEEQPKPEVEDELVVWGHDINVQPGKTYRYRFTIEIYNPLFARKNDLIPAQQGMADKFTLASKTSEWSQPITAQPPLRLFITAARPAGQTVGIGAGTMGSAAAEVYRFRDGRWWREGFNLQPGDRIGGMRSPSRPGDKTPTIDYSTDWFVLDIVQDIGADQNAISQGLGAMVLLQSLSDESLTQTRQPRDDASNSERSFLRQEVQAAGAVASAQ